MNRVPFSLASVQAARKMKSARPAETDIPHIKPELLARIESLYADVPDAVLARLERLLIEREQLKQMISTLLGRVA